MITIAHKIELVPNNKQKTYFRKAFGCSRLAYNWGLAEWERRYKAGETCSAITLNNTFNSIKKEKYPFVYEVTKYACSQPFRNLERAYKKAFKDYKKGVISFPKFKRKKSDVGSFYIGGDHTELSDINKNSVNSPDISPNKKRQYLKVPNLGWVKMTERLRFSGKINGVTISQKGDKFFASFSVQITTDEFKRTHKHSKRCISNNCVGIDLGLKSSIVLSDGLEIKSPKPLLQNLRKIKKIGRQLDKRVHARTKQDRLCSIRPSKNYCKLSISLSNAHRKIANIRRDFQQKVTTILTTHYKGISIESLNVEEIRHHQKLARPMEDASLGEFCREIKYKSLMQGIKIVAADRFYPSSKMCSVCGNIKDRLTLNDRIYQCNKCGNIMDRDYNASLNLRNLLHDSNIGKGFPESTPVDLTALLSRFEQNGIVTSKIETGRQHQSFDFVSLPNQHQQKFTKKIS